MIPALLLLAATTTAPAPAVSNPQSLQARFQAATDLLSAGKCEDAVREFDALAAMPRVASNVGVMSTIKLRKGRCLALMGEQAAATDLIESGLKSMPDGDNYRLDRHQALMALGVMARRDLAFERAGEHYQAALAIADDPADRVGALLGLAQTVMFDDPAAATRHAQAALALAAAQPDASKRYTADVNTIYGRVQLANGDAKGAVATLKKAVQQQGGLGTRVRIGDVITRSDVAIAAMRAGDSETAREYLAYTGAGRFDKAPFATARSIELPDCMAEGIRPDDAAIVEFSIDNNGAVTGAQPVWASRPGPMARAFAQAVRGWSWSAEDVQKIPMFFRLVTRVELRCSNANARPSPLAVLRPAVESWMAKNGLKPVETDASDAARLPRMKAALDQFAGKEGLATVPILADLVSNRAASLAERKGWFDQLTALLDRTKAPAAVRAYWAVTSVELDPDAALSPNSALNTLLLNAAVIADSEARAVLLMTRYDALDRARRGRGSRTDLESVIADKALTATHPLKVGALVRLADLQARAKDLEGARASYAATGLDAQQCALIGPTPVLTRSGVGSSDFPQEAMRWGFEGWVRFETDIGADGRTFNQRALIAYPPFIFVPATLGIVKGARFSQTYRPEGNAGCTAYQTNVNFRLGL